MRTLLTTSLTTCVLAMGQTVLAGQVNFPGDVLPSDGHYLQFSNAYSEWQSSGDYITNSTSLEEDDRKLYSVRGHGNHWQHNLTYLYGLNERWNVGVEQGFAESRWHQSQSDEALNNWEGSFESAGETDLTLLARYRLAKGASLNMDLALPTAGANQATSNTTDTGRPGEEGQGYTRFGAELAANWRTELGTHWMGSVRLDLANREKVNGEGVTGPWCIAFNFGSHISLTKTQGLIFQWHLMRGLPYKSYSAAMDQEVSFGDQSRLGLNTEYQWNLTESVQLQGFLNLAMTQPPVHKFRQNGVKERIEYTGGTYTTLGVALKTEF